MQTLKEWINTYGLDWNVVSEGNSGGEAIHIGLVKKTRYDDDFNEARDLYYKLKNLRDKVLQKDLNPA